ncbi:co-chaperone GroES [Candidatus Parcubacteria bacterium]|nr:co-chaperone GroES [Candidatus Parcubacteria bacterium]
MKKKASKKSPKKPAAKAAREAIQSFGLRPLADRVIIKEQAKEETKKTEAGIIIPDNGEKDASSRRGEVVAAGPGRYDDGDLLPMTLKVGDTVLFQWGEKVKIDGVEYFIVREGDILGVLS